MTSSETFSNWPPASVEAVLDTADGIAVLTYSPLDVQQIISSVGDDRAGATAVFLGTTRNSFKGGCASPTVPPKRILPLWLSAVKAK